MGDSHMNRTGLLVGIWAWLGLLLTPKIYHQGYSRFSGKDLELVDSRNLEKEIRAFTLSETRILHDP